MLRTVIAENRCERQWKHWYDTGKFGYGLVIGLPSVSGPDYVIHVIDTKPSAADTPAAAADVDAVSSSSDAVLVSPSATAQQQQQSDVRINYEDLLDHALNALRMMPGCCYVLGLFTVERTMPQLGSANFKQQVKMLRQLSVELQNNHWIYGSPDDYDYQDKLILNYAGPTDGVRCTNVPCATDGPLAALRLEVEPRPIDWVSFYSQLAEPFEFRIARRADGSADIEENVWQCVQTLAGRLRNSRIFMEADAALNAPGVSVSNYLKLHKNDTQTIRTRLYFEVEDPIEGQLYGASRHNGYIRCMGEVSACVFAHPTQMIADIDRYLRSDLMRSVSGRLRLFLDAFPGMADDQRLHAFSRLQPPRRVFFYPFLGSRIQFTDYLFDTEDAKVTVVNARQVFNVDITPYMVDQKREKMRLPKQKPLPDSDEPEVPQLVSTLLRGRNIGCNMALIVAIFATFLGLSLFVMVRKNADKDMLTHYF